MALYCGQGAGALKSVDKAEDIVLRLAAETEIAIEELSRKRRQVDLT